MRITHLALALTALSLVACSPSGGGGPSSGSGGTGTLTVLATDAFLSHTQVAEARIEVTTIRVHQSAGASSGFITVYEGPPITMDLLNLRNGVVQPIAQAQLPAGTYRQLRLIFSDAYLKLVNGNEYSTALGNLSLTSQATSGLKVFISPAIVLPRDGDEQVLLDFDLTKTFHPIPANNPLTASRYKLQPVVRATSRAATGDISGLVTTDDGTGTQIGVEAASVYVLPPGEPDKENAIVTTATEASGSYTVLGLDPGLYDVLAEKLPLQGRVNGVSVTVENTTLVDIEIE